MNKRTGSLRKGVPAKRGRRNLLEVKMEELKKKQDVLDARYKAECAALDAWSIQAEPQQFIYNKNVEHNEQWYEYALGSLKIQKDKLRAKQNFNLDITGEVRDENLRKISADEETEMLELESEKVKKRLDLKSQKEKKELELKSQKELEVKREQERAKLVREYELKRAELVREHEQTRGELVRAHEQKRAQVQRDYEQKLQSVGAEDEMTKLKLKSEKEAKELEIDYEHRLAELRRVYKFQRSELAYKLGFKQVNLQFYREVKQVLEKQEVDDVQLMSNDKESQRQTNRTQVKLKKIEILQERIRRFLDSLRGAEVVQDNMMDLPNGVCLGGNASLNHLQGTMLIRTCYVNLCELLFEKCEIEQQPEEEGHARWRRFTILGNPGIGKSLFSYYLIYRLIQKKQTIVWQPHEASFRVLIGPSPPIEFGDLSTGFGTELESTSTWYIVDAARPQLVDANTVLVTSPREDIIKPFERDHSLLLYMPVWSETEIELARGHQLASRHPDGIQVSVEHTANRLQKYGGIPRYVFEFSNRKKLKSNLNDAVSKAAKRLIEGTEIVGDLGDPDPTSHMVVRLTPSTEEGPKRYLEYTRSYASPHIEGLVRDCFDDLKENDLLSFLNRRARLDSCGTLAGMIFETRVHNRFEEGGVFRVRKLDKERVSTIVEEIKLEKSTRHRYKILDELTAEKNAYWIPSSKTYEAIDSLKLPNMLFQVTIAKDHAVKKQQVVDVVAKIRALHTVEERGCVIRFYFAVPLDEFETYTQQNYLDYHRHVLKGIENDIPGVEQYVLCAPIKATK